MTQVVYEGPTGRKNPLRTQLGYRVGKHDLPVGEPVDLPEDVAEQLLGDKAPKGHKFRRADDDDAKAPADGESGGDTPAADEGPLGDPAGQAAPTTTSTTRGRKVG